VHVAVEAGDPVAHAVVPVVADRFDRPAGQERPDHDLGVGHPDEHIRAPRVECGEPLLDELA
jgi:hypothetical protein